MGPGSSRGGMGQQGGMGQGSGMGREWRAKEGRGDRERMWHRGEMWPWGKDVGWRWMEMVDADTGITPGKNPGSIKTSTWEKRCSVGSVSQPHRHPPCTATRPSPLHDPDPWAPGVAEPPTSP